MSEGAFRVTLVTAGVFVLLLMANRWVLLLLVGIELLVLAVGAMYFLSQTQKLAATLHEREGQLEDARRQITDLGAALQALRMGRVGEVDLRESTTGRVGGSRSEEEPTWPRMRYPARPHV